MNDSPLFARTTLTLAIAAAGALFTLALMLYASQPWSSDGAGGAAALLLVPFALAALSPYLLLAWMAKRARSDVSGSWVLLMIAVLITVPAAWIYVLGFIVEPDPQSGLLFVFIPFYQYLVGGIVVILAAIARGVLGKR